MKIYTFESEKNKLHCFTDFDKAVDCAIRMTEEFFSERHRNVCKATDKRWWGTDDNGNKFYRVYFDDTRPKSYCYWADIFEYEVTE